MPNGLDIFNSNAFGVISLTSAVNKMPYLPGTLGAMGLFEEVPIDTTTAAIEEIAGVLSLIQTSKRGGPAPKGTDEKRKLRSLVVPHIKYEDELTADQVQGVRTFGSMSELESVQAVVNRKLQSMTRNLDLTLENHRLGAIKGLITDADGSTLYNLFTEFGVTQLAEFDFELDDAAINVQVKCMELRRLMAKELGGIAMANFTIHALCSDAFFDALIGHASVKEAYKYQVSLALRDNKAYKQFEFAGIIFENYRGTDDGTTVTIDANKANFFPVGIPGLFKTVFAPADFIETVNTLGLPRYAKMAIDQEFQRWVKLHVQSNPLCYCERPRVLIKAKRY